MTADLGTDASGGTSKRLAEVISAVASVGMVIAFAVLLPRHDREAAEAPERAEAMGPVIEPPLPDPEPDLADLDLNGLHFTDVTAEAGLDHPQSDIGFERDIRFAGGAAAADFNGDGWLDLFLPRVGLPNLLYQNMGDGTFTDIAATAGVQGEEFEAGYSAAYWADVDSDADLDLYVLGLATADSVLYENLGDGTFRDVTDHAGLGGLRQAIRPTPSLMFGAAFGDIDRDGDLDLVTLEWGPPRSRDGRSGLFRNDGEGRFSRAAGDLGLDLDGIEGFTPIFADVDRDGWPDLLVAGDFGTSHLYRNDHGRRFEDVTRQLGLGTDENGMGSVVEDLDGDGRLDWFLTSISYPTRSGQCPESFGFGCTGNRAFLNPTTGRWSDVTDEMGVRDGAWGWGGAAQDFDNDGDRDLFMVNGSDERPSADATATVDQQYFVRGRPRFWLNAGTRRYAESAAVIGLAHDGPGRAVVAWDYDSDGDLDLFIVMQGMEPVLYRNDLRRGPRWLTVRLEDARGLIGGGIGASVSVRVGQRTQVAEIRVSGPYGGSGPPEAHFGFGGVSGERGVVTVRWPDGSRTVAEGVELGEIITIGR